MKRIVFSSPYVPLEWIAVHGLCPSRILPSALAENPTFGHAEGVCPYAQAFVNEVCGDDNVGGIVLTTTCDQMRRATDLIRGNTTLPVFLMNVPHTWQVPACHRLYLSELRRLGRFLVRLGGRSPCAEELASVMHRYDESRAAIRAVRGRLSPRRYSEAIAEFNRSGKMDLASATAAGPAGGIPIVILGGPLTLEDYWLFDVIENLGGWVALDATESGERTMPPPFNRRQLRDNPLHVLADAYFGSIPEAFQRPNSPLYVWLKRELPKCSAKGIIVRHYVWCDMWRAEVQRLIQWADIPVLHVDVESGNLSRERTTARVQAFLEILK